jgi:hypothetical protein
MELLQNSLSWSSLILIPATFKDGKNTELFGGSTQAVFRILGPFVKKA